MKITHVIIGLGIGGAELMLKRLVEGLNGKDGMQHSVISLTDLGPVGQQLQDAGISVTALGMKNALSLPSTFFKLRRELKKQKPDIVQTWMYHADFLGGLAAKSLGISNIIWGIRTTDVAVGGSKLTVVLRKICAWLSCYVPRTIVCVAEAGRQVHEKVGYDPSKIIVIPNGFDLEKLNVDPDEKINFRSEIIGCADEAFVIGSVGRFHVEKNQELFVNSAKLINSKFKNTVFLMVGRDNTWENSELVAWIEKNNLKESFILLGERSDVPKCLSIMDVFCLHSKTEGFPNVLGEAMALGLPCVATDVGDVNVLMGSTGKIVDLSGLSISQAVCDLISYDNNKLLEFGEKAKLRLKENYSLESIFEKYRDIYNAK